jgi:hypothetical protein
MNHDNQQNKALFPQQAQEEYYLFRIIHKKAPHALCAD